MTHQMIMKMRIQASQVALVVNNLPANAEDIRDMGFIPQLEKSPGVGSGNSLQHFSMENPMNRGAWQATVHEIAKSQTCLSY